MILSRDISVIPHPIPRFPDTHKKNLVMRHDIYMYTLHPDFNQFPFVVLLTVSPLSAKLTC